MRWDGHGDLAKRDGSRDGMSGIREEMTREKDITGDGIWDGLVREIWVVCCTE